MTLKKLAIFVEGQTEQIFLKSFIEEIAGKKNVKLVTSSCKDSKLLILKTGQPKDAILRYWVLLVDCGSDEKVKSEILDQRESLARAGYSLILGLRDLYPKKYGEISEMKMKMKYRVPTAGIPIHILLAVEEVEAWFIKEHSHFKKIDTRLDPATFKSKFGFDPVNDCAEKIRNPAAVLHQVYSSVGKAYKKSRSQVARTVNVLDYAHLYLGTPDSAPHLSEFIEHIEGFFG